MGIARALRLAAVLLVLAVFVTRGEAVSDKKPSLIDLAVAKAFPDAKIERVTVRLSKKDLERVGKLASVKASPSTLACRAAERSGLTRRRCSPPSTTTPIR